MYELSAVAAILAAVLVAITLTRLVELEHRVASLSPIHANLDALLKHAGVDYDPYGHVPHTVAEALRRGDKIQAIKSYRESTGGGLKEAKQFVEEIQRRAGSPA